jgi:ribosome-binding factor A
LRVGEEIRHVLSGIFGRGEFRDPDLATAQITITEVRIGPDLKRATAFFSRLGRSDGDALVPALMRAAPYLRGQVAKALRLRIAPDLTFTPDLALDYAMKIETLMHRPEIARDLQKEDPEDHHPEDHHPEDHHPEDHHPEDHRPEDHDAEDHHPEDHDPEDHHAVAPNPENHGPEKN